MNTGAHLRSILRESLGEHPLSGVFAVMPPEGTRLPYVTYRRKSIDFTPARGVVDLATVNYDIDVFSADYNQAARIADDIMTAVGAIDGVEFDDGVYLARGCVSDSSEGWAGDSYYQIVSAALRISY